MAFRYVNFLTRDDINDNDDDSIKYAFIPTLITGYSFERARKKLLYFLNEWSKIVGQGQNLK